MRNIMSELHDYLPLVSKRHCDLFEEFRRHFPSEKDNVADWYGSAPNEIVVRLNNGDVIYFTGNENRFGYIHNHKLNERGDYDLSDEEFRVEFSNKLKRIMQARYMTQKELSDKTGISVPVISHYMSGRNLPDFRNLRRIANALKCSISELTYF